MEWCGKQSKEKTTNRIPDHLRSDILRLVACCSFQNKAFQDEFKTLGGVEHVMNQTVLDETDPFLKEWAIFCLRNLTEGNQNIQKHIQEMSMQGVANEAELEDMNLKVQMQKNGKLSVSSISETMDDLR